MISVIIKKRNFKLWSRRAGSAASSPCAPGRTDPPINQVRSSMYYISNVVQPVIPVPADIPASSVLHQTSNRIQEARQLLAVSEWSQSKCNDRLKWRAMQYPPLQPGRLARRFRLHTACSSQWWYPRHRLPSPKHTHCVYRHDQYNQHFTNIQTLRNTSRNVSISGAFPLPNVSSTMPRTGLCPSSTTDSEWHRQLT